MTEMAKGTGDFGPIYMGIDLGTYRASITASNGLRKTILNVVGWPKDDVSRKLFGREVVFGYEALRHRLALNIVRPFEKGVIKYSDGSSLANPEHISKHREAAKELVKYIVSLAAPEKGRPVYGVIGAPAQASVINKQALVEAASETLESVIVVSEPFSVAYGLDMLEDALIIDIGAGTVDLCRMHGALPEENDQITLTTAGDYVDELLLKLVKENHPEVQLTINMAREIKERYGFVSDTNDRVVVKVPVDGKPRVIDITEECRQACKAIVPPILEAAGNLIATYDPEFQESILKNVILAGGMSQLKGLDKLIEEGLEEFGGGKVCRVEEPIYAGANGSLKLAYDMPESFWRQIT
ncbi:MAG TPA: MamK family actin-like protein [Candidatus Hypogeohydataceae bacterium YC38]|nr:MamK family actin-like protein [Candidatus Brocadiales bacterium]